MSGCGDKPSEQPRTDAPEQPQSVAPPVPDVGRLETVEVQVIGLGQSPGEAMAQALQMALLQVNGAVIQSASVTARYGLDVALGQDAASLRASAFAEVVKQKSGGVIQSVQVVDLEEPKPWAKRYKYTIKASISKFKPSAEMQKIKVVVGPDRKSTRLNSSHLVISYAVFCLKKKKKTHNLAILCPSENSIHNHPTCA